LADLLSLRQPDLAGTEAGDQPDHAIVARGSLQRLGDVTEHQGTRRQRPPDRIRGYRFDDPAFEVDLQNGSRRHPPPGGPYRDTGHQGGDE
jgi:hypothetical protein